MALGSDVPIGVPIYHVGEFVSASRPNADYASAGVLALASAYFGFRIGAVRGRALSTRK
jgi:hypothetical protein